MSTAILERLTNDGPTEEEKHEFIAAALSQLSQNGLVSSSGSANDGFNIDISQTAEAVNAIDRGFQEITGTFFSDYFTDYAGSAANLWPFFEWREEWKMLGVVWEQRKWTSYYAAEKNIGVLGRFDNIYLEKVENIQTEADRLGAMRALQEFIDDNDDNSGQIALGFLNLKRDIAAFMTDFGKWTSTLGLIPNAIVGVYKNAIETTAKELADLDQQILTIQCSLAVAGSTLVLLGDTINGVASSVVLAVLQSQRNEKASKLANLQGLLRGLQQIPILQLQARLDSWKPDLDQIFDRMVRIGEIWTSVRSQAVQFKGQIEGGLQASRNARFKTEVRLARAICGPLMTGLGNYMQGLHPTT